jgi:hypothetical protein
MSRKVFSGFPAGHGVKGMIGSAANDGPACLNAEQTLPSRVAKRSDDPLAREGLRLFVEGGHDVPDLDLLNRLAINECASGKALIHNHQVMAETRQGIEMLWPADGLHAGDRDRCAPFVPACAHLPDDRRGVDHEELVCRLLQQLLPVRHDQRVESQTPRDFSKHQGFAAARGEHEQGPTSLRGALIGGKNALNTGFLIGPQGDERRNIMLG